MKSKYLKILLTFLLLFSIKLGYTQDVFETVSFDRGDNWFVSPYHYLTAKDGGYLVVSDAGKYSGNNMKSWYSLLQKYDVNGTLLWEKLFEDISIQSVCNLNDGSIIIMGTKLFMNGFMIEEFQSLYVVRLNPCGDVEWAKLDNVYHHEGVEITYARCMVDTGDGVVIPIRFKTEEEYIDGAWQWEARTDMLKLDYDGNIVYRNGFEFYSSSQEFFGCTLDINGNVWMSGTCLAPYPGDETSTTNSPLIAQCDSDGNLLYIKNAKDKGIDVYGAVGIYDKPIVDSLYDVFLIPPLSVIITGPNNGEYYVCSSMIKVDKDYNTSTFIIENSDVDSDPYSTRWMRGHEFINDNENIVTVMSYPPKANEGKNYQQFYLDKLSEDRYFKHGSSSFLKNEPVKALRNRDGDIPGSGFSERIYVLDKDAQVLDSLDIKVSVPDYKDEEYMEGILAVENNCLLLFSYIPGQYGWHVGRMRKLNNNLEPAAIDNSQREYDTWCNRPITSGVVKIADYERLYPVSVDELSMDNKPFRLAPNPATDKIRLYLRNGFGEKRVDIYDVSGGLKKSVVISDGFAQDVIDISDLEQGVYVVKLTANDKLIGTEKLLKK